MLLSPQHIPSWKIGAAVVAFVLISLISIHANATRQAAIPLSSQCEWGRYVSVRVFDWANWKTETVTDTVALDALRNLDVSRDMFRWTSSFYGFLWPEDTVRRWSLTVSTSTGRHELELLTSPSTPATVYGFAHRTETIGTDAYGGHSGIHGCAAFAFDARLLAAIGVTP